MNHEQGVVHSESIPSPGDMKARIEADLDSTRGTPEEDDVQCASCHSKKDLVLDHDDGIVVFCRDCLTPISSIPFSEWYVDLGGGD